MRRRRLLVTTVGALALAGCTGRASPGDDPEETTPGPDDTTASGYTTTESGDTTTRPDDAGPYDTIDGVCCPSFADAGWTNCYRRDGRDPDVYVVPSSTTFENHEADGELQTLRVTLHVEGDRTFRLNPYDWAVFRYDGATEGWTRVAPDAPRRDVLEKIAPGETVTWSLATRPHPSPNDDVIRATVSLDSGETHAFHVVGEFVDGPASRPSPCSTTCARLPESASADPTVGGRRTGQASDPSTMPTSSPRSSSRYVGS